MAQGTSGAYNYEINPFQQQMAAQPMGLPEPVEAQVQAPVKPGTLASIEGATSSYFDNYAQLDAFAKDMAKKGIDVFTPNYAEPGGGLPFQTYQKLAAGVQFASNRLANEQKAREQLMEARLKNEADFAQGFNPSTGFVSEDPNSFVSLNATDATKEAALRLRQMPNTQTDTNNLNAAAFDPAVAQIDAMVQSGQMTPQEGAIQKSMLFKATKDTPVFQPRAESGADKTTQGSLELLKNITNQSAGNWTPGTFTSKIINGQRQQVSTRFSGEKLGDQQIFKTDKLGNETPVTVPVIIKDWVRNPTTGEITIRFTDDNIPDKVVDGNIGEEIATSIIASNPKYGGSAAVPQLFAKARELGYLDETSKVIPETQITNPEIGAIDPRQTAVDVALEKSKKDINAALANVDNKIASFKIPTGAIKIDRNDELGLHIYNWKQLGFTEQPTNLTEDDIYNYLDEFGYFSKNEAALKSGKDKPVSKPILTTDQQKRAAELKAKYGIQ